jgi:hypothetical protein
MLHSRAHRVSVERDGDLAVLWACLSSAPLEERRKPSTKTFYEERAKEGVVGLRR